MFVGISGLGYFDTLRVPIIENTAHEHELSDSLEHAIRRLAQSSKHIYMTYMICIHTYIYIYIHTYIHTYIYTYLHDCAFLITILY